ncbi:hypothetical protein EZS27_012342 [termite gut metagenome]|uniref:Integrase catalytic domain-containing protein n=1 Tax=termite gut metagenome TaxID=433724 RepID=A0A5J4S0Z3_9ZZZZ
MQIYGKIQCVTYKELVGGGILSESNYYKYVRNNKISLLQRGGNGRKVLIDYRSLPESVRRAYDDKYSATHSQIKEQLMATVVRSDDSARIFYRDHRLSNGKPLSKEQQAEYLLNAQVMNEMVKTEQSARALHNQCGYPSLPEIWGIVLGTCEKLRQTYSHTLPLSNGRLRQKYNAYKKESYGVLISRKCGNQNTRKVGSSEARLLLKLKRSRMPVYTDAQIFDEFNRQAGECGFKELKSPNSVRNFLYDPSVMPLWYGAVHGELEWKKKFSHLLKTELPATRDALWYGDGTKLNLYYRDEHNKMRTISVYEVMDAYSETLLGYDIAPTEGFECQYRAYRMAVETSKARPYEIVTDNQSGHKKLAAQGLFKKIAHLYKPTAPYNASGKTIESAFGRFQQQIQHKLWYFTGQNITAKKPNSHPDLEFIEANINQLPTLEELKKKYADLRREWNEGAHPTTGISRTDMYDMSENPLSTPVTELDMIEIFWLKSPKPVTYTNSGLKISIGKQTYEYEVYDESKVRDEKFALSNIGRPFYVMYDPYDMGMVGLWQETASGLRLEGYATTKMSIHRATQERTKEENILLREQLESNKRTRAVMQLKLESFDIEEMIAAEYYGLTTPKPKGISQKDMDAYRKEYERGRIAAPVDIPQVEITDKAGDAPQSLGEYQKAVSNATTDELSFWERS